MKVKIYDHYIGSWLKTYRRRSETLRVWVSVDFMPGLGEIDHYRRYQL